MGLKLWEIKDKHLFVLTYPSINEELAKRRLVELLLLGVDELVFEGPVELWGVRVVAKGTTSVVVKGRMGDRLVAVKVRRVDANRASLLGEAEKLGLANTVGVGPSLLRASRNFLVWEFVNGVPLEEWIPRARMKEIKLVVADLLRQAVKLDRIGLVHKELSRVKKHVLVTPKLKPVIFDFETASTTSGKSNLTQLAQALFIRDSPIAEKVRRAFGVEKKVLIEILRTYKLTKNQEVLSPLLD